MKNFILAILLVIPSVTIAKANKKVSISVPGMSCQMCVHGIKKHFKSVVKNVDEDINVDLGSDMVFLNLSKEITEEEIKKRIKDAGYNAKEITWAKK